MPFARDSRTCSTRPATISALPRRTGRRRSSGSRRSPTWWWSSARRTHTTPPAWRRSHVTSAPLRTWSTMPGRLTKAGWTAWKQSALPVVPRRPRSSCKVSSAGLANVASTVLRRSGPPRRSSGSPFRANWGANIAQARPWRTQSHELVGYGQREQVVMSHLGRNIFRRRAVVRGRTGRTAANPLDRLSWEPVPLESVEQLTCASASSLVVVMVGWPDPALARQPPDQGLDVPPGRRPAGAGARGPGRPAAADDVTVPAHDRVRGNQQPQPLAPRSGYH